MPSPTFFNLPEDKRQRILDCAVEEFAEHDFNSASITKIVARSGIAKGSLYQYFTDKADLYQYLLEYAAEVKAEVMSKAVPQPVEMDLFQTLRFLFKEMLNFQHLYPNLAKLGNRAIFGKSPLPVETLQRATKSSNHYFEDLIRQGIKRGEIRPDINPALAAMVFTSAITGLAQQISALPPENMEQDFGAMYEQIVSILENGITSHKAEKDRV
jgi:AcrR family transcriptional regulator